MVGAGNGIKRYEFGDEYVLLPHERLLFRGDTPVRLKPKVFETLLVLVQNAGRVLTKDELITKIWDGDAVEEGNLSQYVYVLRKTFGESPQDHRFILTLPGHGYKFVPAVTRSEANGHVSHNGHAPGTLTSLAVLPLELLGASPARKYLGLTIADNLITRLGADRRLLVRSTTSVLRYAGSNIDPAQIGSELEVGLVLSGTISEVSRKTRINLQLTEIESLRVVWTHTFESLSPEDLEFHDLIVDHVAAALRSDLPARNGEWTPKDPEVYQKWLKARLFWETRTEASLRRAAESVAEIVTADPGFPLGHIGVADAHLLLGEYQFIAPEIAFPVARAAVELALAIDPDLSQAHASLAEYYFYYERDWAKAEQLFHRAIELDPRYASGYHWYAWFLIGMGRHDEALTNLETAQRLDPNSLILNIARGLPFLYKRNYARAIRHFESVLDVAPQSGHALYYLGSARLLSGDAGGAIAALESAAKQTAMQQTFALLGYAYARAGRKAEASGMVDRLDEMAISKYVSPYVRAILHCGLGNASEAITQLRRARDERAAWLVWLRCDPLLDPLRGVPDFDEIVRSLNFPPNLPSI